MRILRRNGVTWILILWMALGLPALASGEGSRDPQAAAAAAPQNPPPAAAPSPEPLSYRRFHRVLGRNLTSNLFSKGNLAPLLIGAAATLAIAPADQEISRAMYDHAREFGCAGQIIGGVVSASFVGGSVLAGIWTKSEHFQSFSYTLAQAYTITTILTQGIKYATHRMRPDGTSSMSFPSGHTSASFAVATVISSYYGKKWGIPLYAAAGLAGISRIEKGSHWPSDVVAGAALGYISGITAIRGTKRELAGKPVTLLLAPFYGRDSRGVSVRLTY